MKKSILLVIVSLLFVTHPLFSQLENGQYFYSNDVVSLDLNITEDGQVISSATLTNNTTKKTLIGKGAFRSANNIEWYEFQTDECNYEFDIPKDKLILSQFDCKNGVTAIKHTLIKKVKQRTSSAVQSELPIVNATSTSTKYVVWGKKPVESADGPTDMWTMPSQMCEGPQSESVKASTTLAPQGKYKYLAGYLCDDDPTTAWVEGNADYGIGEHIELKDYMPIGDGEISILNGHQFSKAVWETNSRVQKFKVSINGKDICVLQLLDVMGVQKFTLPASALNNLGEGKTLKFTILEVYPGTKYKDTAISGIFSCGG